MTIPVGIRGFGERSQPPRLGKIRLGRMVPNKSGKGTHPEHTDYFVTDDNEQGRRLRDWLETDEPRQIPIRFVADTPEECAPYNLEMWGNGTLKCRGNGEVAEALAVVDVLDDWRKDDAGTPAPAALWARSAIPQRGEPPPERRRIPCFGAGYDDAPPCPMYGERGCKPTMHMTYVIRGYPGGLGVWQTDTNSVVNIERVHSYLRFLQTLPGARISDVPLLLSLEERQMKGQTYHFLRLDVDVDAMPEVGALTAGTPRLALAAPDDEDLAATVPDILDVDSDDPDAPFEADAEHEASEAQLRDAVAWVEETRQRTNLSEADVLYNAGVQHLVHLAINLDAGKARFDAVERDARRSRAEVIDVTSTPARESGEQATLDSESSGEIRHRGDLFNWARSAHGKTPADIVAALDVEAIHEIDGWAEQGGGWAGVQQFLGNLWSGQ